MKFISDFENAVAGEAHRREVDGVACAPRHRAEINHYGDILYYNDGDWVDSCTALVEREDGKLELFHWTENRALVKAHVNSEADCRLAPVSWRRSRLTLVMVAD